MAEVVRAATDVKTLETLNMSGDNSYFMVGKWFVWVDLMPTVDESS